MTKREQGYFESEHGSFREAHMILTSLVSCIFGAYAGWAVAHHTVGRECDRIGAFYVEKNVYDCKERK